MGRRGNLKAVDGGGADATVAADEPAVQPSEQSSGQPAADKPKRQRGPNKPPPTFLGGLRAQVEQHEKRIAGLVERRDKARAQLDAANRELESAEAPLREARAILERYPELPHMGPGDQPGKPPLPGEDEPNDQPPPTPQHPDGSPITPPDGQPAGQPPEPQPHPGE